MLEKKPEKKINVFVFFGDDTFNVQEKIDFWKNEFIKKHGSNGLFVADGADIHNEELFAERLKIVMRTACLFAGPKLTVIKNIDKLLPSVAHALFSYLPRVEQTHFVALTMEKADKRQELFKTLTALEKNKTIAMEEFKTPFGAHLATWVEKRFANRGYSISPQTAQLFLSVLGEEKQNSFEKPDMLRIASEIGKLCSYAKDKQITKQAICEVTTGQADARIFSISDTLLTGDIKNSFRLSHALISSQKGSIKQSLIGLLVYLTKEMRGLALLCATSDNKTTEAQKFLGWSPQRMWVAQKKLHKQSFEKLCSMYALVLRLEWSMKTSSINPRGLFDVLICKIAKLK